MSTDIKFSRPLTAALVSPALSCIKLTKDVDVGLYSTKLNPAALYDLEPKIFTKPADTAHKLLENIKELGVKLNGCDIYVYDYVYVEYLNGAKYIKIYDTSVDRAATTILRQIYRSP